MNTILLIDGPYAGRTVNVGEFMGYVLLPADPATDDFLDQVHAHQIDPQGHVRYDFVGWELFNGRLSIGMLATGEGIRPEQLADIVLTDAARKAWQ